MWRVVFRQLMFFEKLGGRRRLIIFRILHLQRELNHLQDNFDFLSNKLSQQHYNYIGYNIHPSASSSITTSFCIPLHHRCFYIGYNIHRRVPSAYGFRRGVVARHLLEGLLLSGGGAPVSPAAGGPQSPGGGGFLAPRPTPNALIMIVYSNLLCSSYSSGRGPIVNLL